MASWLHNKAWTGVLPCQKLERIPYLHSIVCSHMGTSYSRFVMHTHTHTRHTLISPSRISSSFTNTVMANSSCSTIFPSITSSTQAQACDKHVNTIRPTPELPQHRENLLVTYQYDFRCPLLLLDPYSQRKRTLF